MRYCILGTKTGLRVSGLALGTGRLGTVPGRETDRAIGREALAAFAEAGGNFIDTSSAYQFGLAEEMVGDFLAQAGRDRFVVASKYGRTAQRDPAIAQLGMHRRALNAEMEGSLRRLKTDRVDVYFPHFDDVTTPMEEIMGALDDLVRAGKIVHIGLSNFPAWRIAKAATLSDLRGLAPVVVLQLQYNLLARAIEREHVPLAEAFGMAIMAFSPLAEGRLAKSSAAAGEAAAIVAALHEIAAEIGVAASSAALAWVRAKGFIPIIGARNSAQIADNLHSLNVTLDGAQLGRLESVSALQMGYPYELIAQQQKRLASM